MKTAHARRPSPALVLAAVALVFALGGSAIAGPDAVLTKLTKAKVKKISTKQAKRAIEAAEPGLNVNTATTAEDADKLDGQGPAAYLPLAYGLIADAITGTLDAARSSNLQIAKGNGAGRYCFEVTAGDPGNVQATIDYDNSPGGARAPAVSIPAADFGCPSGVDDFSVLTYGPSGATESMGFYLLVH